MSAFKTYYLDVMFRQYADFSGRARRSEFWYFYLFYWLVGLASIPFLFRMSGLSWIMGLILIRLIHLVPLLSISTRRLHDINKSSWNLLWILIPGIGKLIMLLFFIQEGDYGYNQYGPDPKIIDNY